MSKKFKTQASSARVASSTTPGFAFGVGGQSASFQTFSSPLSYVTEFPDFSAISDPSVVVAFKNLTKRDESTKAKALDELKEILSREHGDVPDPAVLEAWISIYPRLSIDNARRVRQLAHSLQGSLTARSGKRIATHLPKVVGAWLAGTFDTDKSVSRLATESFEHAFPSEVKRKAVWHVYFESLLGYVQDAVLKHTPQTLSDERTTSPDDAQAKYVRVVSCGILLLDKLLQKDDGEKSLAETNTFQIIISSKKTWELAIHSDASLRIAVCKLAQDVIARGVDLDWRLLSANFLGKALHTSQTSSSGQFMDTLLAVTQAHPTVWTIDYVSKTPVSRRLHQFLKKGSQRGPKSWWLRLRKLIELVPIQAWNDGICHDEFLTIEGASQLLTNLHEGVINSDEPRQHQLVSWTVFQDVFFWTMAHVDAKDEQQKLAKSFLCPLVENYVLADPELTQWVMPESIGLDLSSSSINKLREFNMFDAVEKLLQDLHKDLVDVMRQEAPGSSKDFVKAQEEMVQKASRYFELQRAVELPGSAGLPLKESSESSETASHRSNFVASNSLLLNEAVKILREQKGKCYGVAGIVSEAIEKQPDLLDESRSPQSYQLLADLLRRDASMLIQSPSADSIISILLRCRTLPCFDECFGTVVEHFVKSDASRRSHAYSTILRNILPHDLVEHPEIQQQILLDLEKALQGNDAQWSTIYDILSNSNLIATKPALEVPPLQPIQGRVLANIMACLSLEEQHGNAMKGLKLALTRQPTTKHLFSSYIHLPTLMNRLLLLADSSDETTADEAARLITIVKKLSAQSDDPGMDLSSMEIVRRQLAGEDEALQISSVIELARDALKKSGREHDVLTVNAVFPTADQWENALSPFRQVFPAISLALTSSFQGFVFLVSRDRKRSTGGLPRDSEGFSDILRLTILVTELLDIISMDSLNVQQQESLYLYYPQALQIAQDKINIEKANSVWIHSLAEVVQEMIDVVNRGQKHISAWIAKGNQGDLANQATLISCWLGQLEQLDGSSVEMLNLGRTFTGIMSEAVDVIGIAALMKRFNSPVEMARSLTVKSASLLVLCQDALGSSPAGRRLCNELVADATGMDFNNEDDALRRLVPLNLLIQGEEALIENIPSQRLIFLVQRLLSVSCFRERTMGLQSELLVTLACVLPHLKDLYGEFWQSTVDMVNDYFKSFDDITQDVPLHAALRLYSRLLALTKQDCNEDLQETFAEKKAAIESSLVGIITLFDEIYPQRDQPLEITIALLVRQVQGLKFDHLEDILELYPLLSSGYRDIQGASYGMIRRSLPAIEEERSIEAVLSKAPTHLPEELLSLLLDAPSRDAFIDAIESTDAIWINIRRYLLSWKVVFEHFSSASSLVRGSFVIDVKDYGHLDHFLAFACGLLRISSGKPIDAAKFNVTDFCLDDATTLEKEASWLAIHVYYLSLLHLPGLCKTWWIEQKNRIKTPLENWSQKHICPHIISASLQSVSEWHAATQKDRSDDERPLEVKVNPRAGELVASISIDPESPAISLCINLPPSYPFSPALVTSRTRVGVSESKWQAWLRTIQGVIMFNTSSGVSSSGSTSKTNKEEQVANETSKVATTNSSSSSSSSGGGVVSGGTGSGLIDGLIAFRHNVSAALFKGQSECAICYSVISTDMKTPEKKCATCKNMFHSACLYRWFKSSNSSSCPLCRNQFNYG